MIEALFFKPVREQLRFAKALFSQRIVFVIGVAVANEEKAHSLQTVFLCEFFKGRKRALYTLGRDAVRDANISLAPEIIAGDKQKIVLLGALTEGVRIRLGRADEQVKGAVRLHAVKAEGTQGARKTVGVVTKK